MAAKADARLRCDLNIDPKRRYPCQTAIAAANWRSGRKKVKEDMEVVGGTVEEAGERARWWQMIRCGDP